ncbi:MAG: penicillin-binding protein 1A [Desulfobacteraceae bacterium]|nr:MAG: penicillin-binding protein 1A [Desulfobacteraceae bacterium]
MFTSSHSLTRKPRGGRWFIGATLITGILCGLTAGAFLALTRDLPQIQSLESFKPSAITRVYSADQVLLAELYIERRDPVNLAQIPEALKIALLTTEDRQFYRHSGIAVRGILRAALKNLLRGRLSEGASTLTQQLAKTLFLTPRKTFVRKMREAVLALQLERRYTKDELLTLYLNQIYFGSGAYGVAAAARTYFNKAIQDLSLSECALIAGLAKAPSRYSPLVSPELARQRRDVVLRQMRATGAIDQTTYDKAIEAPVSVASDKDENHKATYFRHYVRGALEDILGDNLVYKGGLTVYTTLSYRTQTAAQEAIREGLARLEIRMQLNGMPAPRPQAALLALDVNTGGIISMVGGRNNHPENYNRAVAARRQPGSAFKPIVYALAIERGFQQTQTILDAPVVFQHHLETDWQPENFAKSYSGEISLRWALAQSKNIPAVRLIEKLGPSSVVQFAHHLGINSIMHPNLSLALGTSEVTLMELTAAYAVFANQGKYIKPYGILEIRNRDGNIIWNAKPEQSIAMARASAAVITDMLTAVIREGTARSAGLLPGPLAGKTGTTSQFKDALFVGYSPNVAAGVWVGNDDNTTLGLEETGARAALPIWMDFMQHASVDQPRMFFDIPDDVRPVDVDSKTGSLTRTGAAGAVKALVIESTNRATVESFKR